MKIKKIICTLLFCSTIITACSAPATPPATSSSASAKMYGDAVLPSNALSQETVAAGNLITDTTGGLYSEAKYDADYNDMDILTETATDIIYGRINDMSYICGQQGFAWTLQDVTILEVLKGDLEVGATVCVGECRGIISMADRRDSFTPEEWKLMEENSFGEDDPPAMSEEEMENTYFEQSDGTPTNQVGDTILFYIQEHTLSAVEGVMYTPIADRFGRFVENPERGFFRYALGDTREEMLGSVEQFTADGRVNTPSESALTREHYSMDELKQIIVQQAESTEDTFAAEPAS